MLTSLRIENFIIVKELELDFSAGMTAFTGETGAGKSIMIDALMLALGGRAETNVIRANQDKCDISAAFHIEANSEPAVWLHNHDLSSEHDEIILRRVIFKEGRSKSYINGHPFPLQKIKELSEMLVHIHGQHQHQTLMQHATHRQQLDNYAGHAESLHNVQNLYRQCQKLATELQTVHNKKQQAERVELLHFQIKELEQINALDNEMHDLSQEHQLLHHAKDYLEKGALVEQLLNGDEEATVVRLLNQVQYLLEQLPSNSKLINNIMELINTASIQCEEALSELHQFANQVPLDPQRLQQVEERMSILHHAARKYHVDADKLCDELAKLQLELQQILAAEDSLQQLEQQYQQQSQAYQQAACHLTTLRKKTAEKLAHEITLIIQQLGMPKGQVEIEITPLDKMQAHGLDKVEYKVRTNPGTAFDALNKIASGGELSRISLAIQMVTAERGSTPTLLFDEVDVGIGGATAALVGQLLRKLGQRLQVFCVTHQPQVAASAHQHFVVEKFSDDEQTFSRIIALNAEEKIDEIARMLGGLSITKQTRSHAEELIAESH